jgi:hypothetical protein
MMLQFTYDIAQFEAKFDLPHGSLFSDDVIVDVEIRNDIAPDWVYIEGEACAVGILHKDRIYIFIAEAEDDPIFKNKVWGALYDLPQGPLYAFNRNMEAGVLHTLFDGFDFPIAELKPISGPGWSKDRCYQALRMYGKVDGKEIVDIFKGKGVLCADRWIKYRETGEMQWLMEIVEHNIQCLLKQSLIHRHRAWYPTQFKMNDRNFELGKI